MVFNTLVAGCMAALLGAVVLHPRVQEGLVIRCGLVCMALGFAAMAVVLADGVNAHDLVPMVRAAALVHLGLVVAAAGFLWRFRRGRWAERPITDWGVLQEAHADTRRGDA